MLRGFFLFIVFLLGLACAGQAQENRVAINQEIRLCEKKVGEHTFYVYDSLLYYAERQLFLARELEDSLEIGKAYLSLVYANHNSENYANEVKYLYEAENVFKNIGNEHYLELTHLELSSLFRTASTEFYEPLNLLHKAAKSFQTDGSTLLLARCYVELGLIYRNQYKNLATRDSILYYYGLAGQLADHAGNHTLSNMILNNIADYYLLAPQTNPDTVIFLSKKVLHSNYPEKKNRAVACLNTYLAKRLAHNTDSLYYFLKTGFELTTELRPSRLVSQAGKLMFQYFREREAYDSALQYMEYGTRNIGFAKTYTFLRQTLDLNEKEAQLIEQQNAIIITNLNKQRIFIYVLIAGSVLLLAFSIVILKKNAEIKSQSIDLYKKNEQIESLIKEIHHRVKNNLQMIVGLLDLQQSSVSDKIISDVLNDASSRIKAIALIHQKLYKGNTDMVTIGFRKYIEELCDNLVYSYNMMDRLEVKLHIEEIETPFDKAVIFGLLITELITNVLKHAFKDGSNGYIEINVHKDVQDNILLSIADNGIGMPSQMGERSGSFGLDLINTFVEDLNGKIEFVNNNGTSVEVTMPSFVNILV